MKSLVIGTRGSALALFQARLVQSLIQKECPDMDVTLKVIETVGDKDRKTALSRVSQVAKVERGVFIKELEEALAAGVVDLAVHSLKDMPSVLNEGFSLYAYLVRAAAEDVLVSKHLGGIEGLPPNAVVATGGVRRQAQLRWIRPDLEIIEIRGNVPTRLSKVVKSQHLDATMLAAAGLERLGYPVGTLYKEGVEPLYLHRLSTEEFLPAGGQGVIAVEGLSEIGDRIRPILAPLNCSSTERICRAERAFLHHFGASCDTPIAVLARETSTGKLEIEARYWRDGNASPILGACCGHDPDTIAKELAEGILKK